MHAAPHSKRIHRDTIHKPTKIGDNRNMVDNSRTSPHTPMAKNVPTKERSARDSFIVEKAEKGFAPDEIVVLMERNGFKPVARSTVYEILAKAGIKPKPRK